MKTLLRSALPFAAVVCLLLSSCQKLESTATTVEDLPKATINLVVAAQLNDQNFKPAEGYPKTPRGKAILSASYSDLGLTGTSGNYNVEVNLGGGKVSVEVPVALSGTAYSITFNNFVTTYKNAAGDSRSFIFHGALQSSMPVLMPGSVVVLKALYSAQEDLAIQ